MKTVFHPSLYLLESLPPGTIIKSRNTGDTFKIVHRKDKTSKLLLCIAGGKATRIGEPRLLMWLTLSDVEITNPPPKQQDLFSEEGV